MLAPNEDITLNENGWVAHVQSHKSGYQPTRMMLLVHGWQGDEKVMSIFARGLPPDQVLVFPRGPVLAGDNSYGWVTHQLDADQWQPYRDVANRLWEQIQFWHNHLGVPENPIDLMGFSQGAAVCYALALTNPRQVNRVAALAGYMPAGAEEHISAEIAGIRFFVAHGNKDDIVPVERARQAVQILQTAGAQVTYCEDEVGHKLSASCFRGLSEFFHPNVDR